MLQSYWLDLLLSVGLAQSIFLSIVLWQKKMSNYPAVFYLTLMLVMLGVIMLLRATYQPDWVKYVTALILIPDAILFLIGPFLYFFTRSLLQLPLPQKPYRYWHFIPATIHILLLNTFIGLHLNEVLHFLNDQHIQVIFFYIEGLSILSLTSYIWLSVRDYRHYRAAWQQRFSQPFPAHFLRPFFITGYLLVFFWLLSFLNNLFSEKPDYTAYFIMWLLLVAYVFFLGYQILLRPDILELPPLKIYLAEAEMEKVATYVREQKPYLNPDLKLQDLAEALQMPKNELSKILNHAFGKNFFDYINHWRIQEFIELHKHPRNSHLNISDMAYLSGFNSRTAFNRAFRKATGKTPSAYFNP
ncbi:MAG TPA: helix-turn-helix transcriptional regulator [Saprospiraceae bacterium]|nr:helix-turn-helix transcriptional regulator [Saprospiraceae bacterium]HMQ81777.1 helix-turn-helix transcriptional regulator [Saprospiraceae bacterium]